MRDEGLQANAAKVGAALLERLKDPQSRHEAIRDMRGRGLMAAIEIVKDRAKRTHDREAAAAVFEACRTAGLILSKSGPNQSVLRMVPSLCLSLDDVDQAAEEHDAAFSSLG